MENPWPPLTAAVERLRRPLGEAAFLRFAILPFLILFLMNMVWGDSIENIGCVGLKPHRMGYMYSPNPEAVAGCTGNVAASLSDRPSPSAGQAEAPPPPRPPVAIAQGRFEWMTFHLVALVLLPGVAALSLLLMWRNLRPLKFAFVAAATCSLGALWFWYSLSDREALRQDTASLLLPTRELALVRFDASFAAMAWENVVRDYGAALAVTVLIVIAAATVLENVGYGNPLDEPALKRKRVHLKLAIALASILMTFIAFYVGEWLAWPAHFAPSAGPGNAAEIRAAAAGLRLFFGAGYTLALIGFALPAVAALSRGEAAKPGPEKDDAGAYFYQRVFTQTEAGLLISVLTPFLSTLTGSALAL